MKNPSENPEGFLFMPRTVTYQIQQYLLVQAIWGIFHSGVDVPSGFHIYSLADVLKVDIKWQNHFISTFSHHMFIKFISQEIICISRRNYQNE